MRNRRIYYTCLAIIALLALYCLQGQCSHDPYSPPDTHRSGKSEAVERFLEVREAACSGKTPLHLQWKGTRGHGMKALHHTNMTGGLFTGADNYAIRCYRPNSYRMSGQFDVDKQAYYRHTQMFLVQLYSIQAMVESDKGFCQAEVESWTDPYYARSYNHTWSGDGVVQMHMTSNMDARCKMRMTDGRMTDPTADSRHEAICRSHLGYEDYDERLSDTYKVVDIKLRFPDGSSRIWSMYKKPIKLADPDKSEWGLLEVDKNYCYQFRDSLDYIEVAKTMGATHHDVIQGRYNPKWLFEYWRRASLLKEDTAQLIDTGYRLGADYHHPLRKWYYVNESPYYKALW